MENINVDNLFIYEVLKNPILLFGSHLHTPRMTQSSQDKGGPIYDNIIYIVLH
jgi:hypothetical protein